MQNILKPLKKHFSTLKPSTHKTFVPTFHYKPQVYYRAFVQPSATIVGETQILDHTYVGNNTVIKGDMNNIFIDQYCVIGDNVAINTLHRIKDSINIGQVTIEDRTVIMSNSTIVASEIGRWVYIGENTVICEGCKINDYAVIGPNSVVPPNTIIDKYEVWTGNPLQFVKKLNKPEKGQKLLKHWENLDQIRRLNTTVNINDSGYMEAENFFENLSKKEQVQKQILLILKIIIQFKSILIIYAKQVKQQKNFIKQQKSIFKKSSLSLKKTRSQQRITLQ